MLLWYPFHLPTLLLNGYVIPVDQGECALDLDSIDIISADGDAGDDDDDDDDDATGAAVKEILEKEPSELEVIVFLCEVRNLGKI